MTTPAANTYIIGDIHGCLGRIEKLLEIINPHPERDRMVFLGDYVDRGPDPKGVVDLLIRVKAEHPATVFLRGNHEEMFLSYLGGDNKLLFFLNGGGPTLESYGLDMVEQTGFEDLPEEHRRFYGSLKPYLELKDYILVHAGLRPGVPLEEQDPKDLVWIRQDFIYSEHDFGKTVVFGHTVQSRPLVMHNKIGIDTGAVYGGRLTCLVLPEEEFVSV